MMPRALPPLIAFAAAILWGIWWIPIRQLSDAGLQGGMAGVAMNLGAVPLLLAIALIRRGAAKTHRRALLGAAFVGLAITTYSAALNYTDVIRAVLLFYTAPVWSKLIEWAFLGEKWGLASTVALALSLTGAFVILGGDISLAAFRLGDILALVSGLAWAVGASLIFSSGQSDPIRLSLVAIVSAIIIGTLFAQFETGTAGGSGAVGLIAAQWQMALLMGTIYLAPVVLVTLWSAHHVPPAALTFLLTAEVVSGVVSTALLLDEPFGPLHAIGATLIIAGAIAEVTFVNLRRQITQRIE